MGRRRWDFTENLRAADDVDDRLLETYERLRGSQRVEGKRASPRWPPRDSDGRFSGRRTNVESVFRLPTFPARWVLEDPRRRPYFVFWSTYHGDAIAALVRMERAGHGAVLVTTPSGYTARLDLIVRSLPIGSGCALLYSCPGCQRPRRYLYVRLHPLDYWRCPACVRFRWQSQGQYRSSLDRSLRAFFSAEAGMSTLCREPYPRYPRDPRAVSDPRLLVGEFTNLAVCQAE